MSLTNVIQGVAEVAGDAVGAQTVFTSKMREGAPNLPAVVVVWSHTETMTEARTFNKRDTSTGKLMRAGVVRVHSGDVFVLLSMTGDTESEEPDIAAAVDALMDAFDADAGLSGSSGADRVRGCDIGRIERYESTAGGVRYAGVKAPFTAYEA